LIFVRGLEVSTKSADIRSLEVESRLTLFEKRRTRVLLDARRVESWRLLVYSPDGDVFGVSSGDRVRLARPVILYRVCAGENMVSVVRGGEGVEVRRVSQLCTRRADEYGFCSVHRSSEYRKYLSYVFGLAEPRLDVGLMHVPHMVYLLQVGGGSVKVGIANGLKNVNRLYEQGFLHAVLLAFVGNGVEARRIEEALKDVGIADRATTDERLQWFKTRVDLDQQLRLFVSLIASKVIPRLGGLGVQVAEGKSLPVMRFSEEYYEKLREVRHVQDVEHLSALEGVYEVGEYLPGGFILRGEGSEVYVPYSFVRDRALNAELVR